MYKSLIKKKFQDLNDNEILSLAIDSLEEDIKLYDEYSSHFLINYPVTSKMFKQMSILKNKNRKKLVELHKNKFGETLSITNQKEIANYFKRKPEWLVIKNSIEKVRNEIIEMETLSAKFYNSFAKKSPNIEIRNLLIDLAIMSREQKDNAKLILLNAQKSRSAKEEVTKDKRQFILTWVQPGLAGLMDGSVSTLAPIFATAFATKDSHTTLLVGLAASIGAGISMGFTEAVHDDGVISGRGSPIKRGFASGIMTTIGGLGHALPYLISDFYVATVIAMFFVLVELWAIAWIQAKYMEIKFTKAVFQVVFGGSLVLAAGILIGGG
ncbi:MAG: rubrerythrin family protein [SAR202 cluster bacterium]|nr:rubrerythrin family protein [SAR202 cluster bacterium]